MRFILPLAVVGLLVASCFLPWMTIETKGITITGMDTTGTTYGKPVGFFPIPVGEWYVFPVSFRSANKNGEGNYFNGIPVNSAVADGLDKDWGDLSETSLASAIRNITSGAFKASGEGTYIEPPAIESVNRKLDEPFLKVTIGKKK